MNISKTINPTGNKKGKSIISSWKILSIGGIVLFAVTTILLATCSDEIGIVADTSTIPGNTDTTDPDPGPTVPPTGPTVPPTGPTVPPTGPTVPPTGPMPDPPTCDVMTPGDDCDGDLVANSMDAFPSDACASVDTDNDGSPDAVILPAFSGTDACTTASSLVADAFSSDGCAAADTDNDGSPDAVILPAFSLTDACTTASSLVADAFSSDGCAAADSDGDTFPDMVIAPGFSPTDACTTASSLVADAFDTEPCAAVDSDGDTFPDMVIDPVFSLTDACTTASSLAVDVDTNNNGLIDVASMAALQTLRDDLNGDGVDDGNIAGISALGTSGAPGSEQTACDDGDPATTIRLCGYELVGNIALSGNWIAIGGDNDLATEGCQGTPAGFDTILEGNGNLISGLAINGSGAQGLFACLAGATISNLRIATASGSMLQGGGSTADHIGILAGSATGTAANATLIDKVAVYDGDGDTTSMGDVDISSFGGSDHIGALIGHVEGNVRITSSVARRIGLNGGGGSDAVGGLIGNMMGAPPAAPMLTLTPGPGLRASMVIDGTATINPTGGAAGNGLGGLLGRALLETNLHTITLRNNIVSGGTLTGGTESAIGGLVGRVDAQAGTMAISNSLSTAAVAGGTLTATGAVNGMGAFIGRSTAGAGATSTLENVYWDTATDTADMGNGTYTGIGNVGTATDTVGNTIRMAFGGGIWPLGVRTSFLQDAANAKMSQTTNAASQLPLGVANTSATIQDACLAAGGTFFTGPGNCNAITITIYNGWSDTAWKFDTGNNHYPCLKGLDGTNLGGSKPLTCN